MKNHSRGIAPLPENWCSRIRVTFFENRNNCGQRCSSSTRAGRRNVHGTPIRSLVRSLPKSGAAERTSIWIITCASSAHKGADHSPNSGFIGRYLVEASCSSSSKRGFEAGQRSFWARIQSRCSRRTLLPPGSELPQQGHNRPWGRDGSKPTEYSPEPFRPKHSSVRVAVAA